MDLYHLRVLRELGDRGSITATATALGVTPPAVSQILSALQRQFQTPLTQRSGRIVELSDAGRALARAAAEVATAVARAESVVDEFVRAEGRTVRVSAFHSASVTIYPALIARSQEPGFPDLECVDEDVDRSSFPALTARYDLVIGHRMSHSPPWPDDTLVVRNLLNEPIDVAVHRSSPLASAETVTPTDLLGMRWVSTHLGFSPADMLEAVSASAGAPMRVEHRINDFPTALAILAQGDHVALLPRYTSRISEQSDIVLRPLEGLRTTRSIDLLIRPERAVYHAIARVADALSEITASMISAAEELR